MRATAAPPMSLTTPVVDVPPSVVEDVLPAPVVEFFAPVSGVTFEAPAPVGECLAPVPAPAVHAAPAPVTQVPQVQIIEHGVKVQEIQSGQGTPTSERLGTAPVRRVCFAETLDMAHGQLSVKMHVAAALHHSAQRGARVDAVTNTATTAVATTQTMTYAVPAPVVEYISPPPTVHSTPAPVIEYVATEPVTTDNTLLLEPPVPVVQVVQVPQVQDPQLQIMENSLRLQRSSLLNVPKLLKVWDCSCQPNEACGDRRCGGVRVTSSCRTCFSDVCDDTRGRGASWDVGTRPTCYRGRVCLISSSGPCCADSSRAVR